ncbi:MAG TPA: MauE/DoxX family redox-associated membrane protein [Xanthomonadales bacterium]|nr:MauE/DoxX family redox-associated membrane protein [Xanthomonadales bacterium]
MHPGIKQAEEGRCPKCGMELVASEKVNKLPNFETNSVQNSYKPLVVIIGLITSVALAVTAQQTSLDAFGWNNFISNFMAGFFIVFAGFKLIDLKGFAEGYSTYDLLAKRWFAYGYIYPFIELFFGLSMILNFYTWEILWVEVIVMAFSGLGVAVKLLRHEKFQCACLGTFLKVPLTKITLIEDFGMSFLALVLIVSG